MIYGRATDNSMDDKDATRTLGTRFFAFGYTSVTIHSAAETLPPDGFADLVDTRG